MTPQFIEYERKVHFRHHQNGATFRSGNKDVPFANTLCKMNSNVPASHITDDPSLVTCKICRRHQIFRAIFTREQNEAAQRAVLAIEPAPPARALSGALVRDFMRAPISGTAVVALHACAFVALIRGDVDHALLVSILGAVVSNGRGSSGD